MADKIFPSTNDVGVTAGEGRVATEVSLSEWRSSAAAPFSHYRNGEQVSPGGILSGFDFSAGTATSITLTAGTAIIEGYKVEDTDTIVGVLTASTFNFVFLALTKSGGLVTGLELQVRTAAGFNTALASVPDDAILIWCFETDGSSIVTQYDFRAMESGVISGSYVGDDAATRTIDLGFRPKLVQVARNDAALERFIAQSPMAVPYLGTQRGFFLGDTGYVTTTADPEHVPILSEEGFTIEDGPATPVSRIWLEGTKSYATGAIAAGNVAITTIAVTGARVDDLCIVDHAGWLGVSLIVHAQVLADDVVTIYHHNAGSGSTSAAGNLTVGVLSKNFAPKLNELNQVYHFVAWY